MKTIVSCLVITAALSAKAALGACEMPSLVTAIPDGATSTEAELLRVQTEVKAYVAAMDRYIACTNEEITAEGENAAAVFLQLMTERIEAARIEVDTIATRFNEQVNAFRAARQPQAFPGR